MSLFSRLVAAKRFVVDGLNDFVEHQVSLLMTPDVRFADVGMVDGGDVLADGERQFGDEVQVGGERRMRAGEFGKQRFGVEQDGFNVSGCGAGTGALFASGLACAGQQGDDVFSSLRVVGAHDVSNLSCDGLGYGPDGRYALFNFKFAPARPFRPLSSNPKNVRGA